MDKGVDLIGAPFRYGARGPDEFDCYGLVMEMSRRNGKPLPDFGFNTNQALIAAMMGATMPQWRRTDCRPGAVALIRIGRYCSHVAYVIDETRIIHCWQDTHGVTIEPIETWKHRIEGYYEYVGS